MTQKQRYEQAHAELAGFIEQGGKQPKKALRRVEILRESDPEIYAACEQAIRNGSLGYALEILERVKFSTSTVTATDVGAASGSKAGAVLSWVSGAVWASIAAICWLAFPGVGPALALLVVGWVLSIVALSVGGSVAASFYDHYSGLGEFLGALVFLAVPLTLPIGLIWTIVRALRIQSGVVDGPGRNPQPGGGYGHFEKGDIGPAGRPIARALLLLALGHTVALVGFALRSGLISALTLP